MNTTSVTSASARGDSIRKCVMRKVVTGHGLARAAGSEFEAAREAVAR